MPKGEQRKFFGWKANINQFFDEEQQYYYRSARDIDLEEQKEAHDKRAYLYKLRGQYRRRFTNLKFHISRLQDRISQSGIFSVRNRRQLNQEEIQEKRQRLVDLEAQAAQLETDIKDVNNRLQILYVVKANTVSHRCFRRNKVPHLTARYVDSRVKSSSR